MPDIAIFRNIVFRSENHRKSSIRIPMIIRSPKISGLSAFTPFNNIYRVSTRTLPVNTFVMVARRKNIQPKFIGAIPICRGLHHAIRIIYFPTWSVIAQPPKIVIIDQAPSIRTNTSNIPLQFYISVKLEIPVTKTLGLIAKFSSRINSRSPCIKTAILLAFVTETLPDFRFKIQILSHPCNGIVVSGHNGYRFINLSIAFIDHGTFVNNECRHRFYW